MSKIKLIVEIEKRTYELIKDKPDNIAESIIANGIPYNSTGDAISREALKDIAYINKGNFNTIEGIREWIDNAQAIPQGEWARHDEWRGGEYIGGFYHVNCPCEDGYYSKWRTNFCPNCGQPMMKGDAEE